MSYHTDGHEPQTFNPMNRLPDNYPFGMTGKQLDELTKDSVVKFNPHLEDEGEIMQRCDFCSVNVPESTIEKLDGYSLCQDCYTEYANTPEIEND